MAKYSFEFKRKIVQEYLDGLNTKQGLAREYNIKSTSCVRSWINAYKEFGNRGLLRSRQNKKFSLNFKLHAVQLYLSTEISYRDLAYSLGMKEPSVIAGWISSYRRQGIEGLKSKRSGRRPKMRDKPKRTVNTVSAENIKETKEQLKQENLHLRIMVAYLKELRKLRRQEAQKRRQELSATSEDHLD